MEFVSHPNTVHPCYCQNMYTPEAILYCHDSCLVHCPKKSVGHYAVMIAEEDGDIDTDLPGKA